MVGTVAKQATWAGAPLMVDSPLMPSPRRQAVRAKTRKRMAEEVERTSETVPAWLSRAESSGPITAFQSPLGEGRLAEFKAYSVQTPREQT